MVVELYEIKFSESQNQKTGTIIRINRNLHCTFIMIADGTELYGNENSFKYRSDFDNLKEGARRGNFSNPFLEDLRLLAAS